MKNKKIMNVAFILFLVLFLFIGCKKANSPLTGPVETLDLVAYFPTATGYSWQYDGSYDYQSIETVINIEEDVTQGIKRYYIEGAVTDLSDGEAGDLNYTKIIGISKDQILDVSGSQKSVLLKNPIQVGQTWETVCFDDQLGYYQGMAEIVGFSEGRISVKYSPLTPADYPKGLEATLTFDKERGIVAGNKNLFLSLEDETLTEFSFLLTKTFVNKPSELYLRYYSEHPLLKKLYIHQKRYYDEIENAEVYWHYTNKTENIEMIVSHFEAFLQGLAKEDIKSLDVARSTLIRIVQGRKDADGLVRAYLSYAESIIGDYFYDLSYQFDVDSSRLDQLMAWNEETSLYEIAKITGTTIEEVKIFAPLLRDAGILPFNMEGYMYTTLDALKLLERLKHNVSKGYGQYLDLLIFDYQNFPMFYEGYMSVDKGDYLEYLINLDLWAETYPESPEAQGILDKRSYGLAFYLLPNYLYEDNSFVGGFMSQSYVDVIFSTLEKHKENSTFLKILKEAINLLKANGYLITENYYEWLLKQGVEGDSEALSYGEEAFTQFEELENLVSLYEVNPNLKSVEVSNIEELIESIGSNKRIVLQPGAYPIPYYVDNETQYASITEGVLTIKGVTNLVIEGSGERPTTMLSEGNSTALQIENSTEVSLVNLRIGHSLEYCTAESLSIITSRNINVINSIVFGCGEWGMSIADSSQVKVLNCLIADCNTYALKAYNAVDVELNNCVLTRNGKNVVFLEKSGNVLFDKVYIIDNTGDAYTTDQVLIYLNEDRNYNITLKDSVVSDNKIRKLTNRESEFIINNCSIED